jgi:hypothetical protein
MSKKTLGRPPLTRKQFMAKLVRNEMTGCLEWHGLKNANGYGRTTIRGRNLTVHRYVWELFNGPISQGLCVCHKCDNRQCAEPTHLFLGTTKDNSEDMVRKGRSLKGERNNKSKLTPDDVRAIRASNERQVDLAARYGVTQAMVSQVKLGNFWRHVA